MASTDNIWVGIEVTRELRIVDGQIAPAGGIALGGVNLLEHQLQRALELTPAEQICIMTPQADEPTLELIARYGVRELSPMDFIAMLSDRVNQGEEGGVVLLRQIAPVRDVSDIRKALKLLKKHPVVVSASKPPKGHPRNKPHPDMPDAGVDLRCLAFEVRRMAEFNVAGAMGISAKEPHELHISWQSFAEVIKPEDEKDVAEKLSAWQE
jgi:hypothetical protein